MMTWIQIYETFLPRVDGEWRIRFASPEHHGLSVTPQYLEEDARLDRQEAHVLQPAVDGATRKRDGHQFEAV